MLDEQPDTKIDPEEMFRSLTGFEEIAIHNLFRTSASELAMRAEKGDTFPFMRALLFIDTKRQGCKDGEAYKNVMNMPAGDVAESFIEQTDEESEGKD